MGVIVIRFVLDEMELILTGVTLLATIVACVAQPQSAPVAPQGPSAPLLGVRYSAATDVSRVSFNSPLVTYGASLNEIQLPAAPIQQANLKRTSTPEGANNEGNQQGQIQQQQQQIQSPTAANQQQQFLSIQQYPANPQPQGFSLSQTLPGPQAQAQATPSYVQQPQPQQLPQQYVLPQQQQYLAPQQQQQYPGPYSPVASNAYFATGPFAAPYQQPGLVAGQYSQPQSGQPTAPAQLVSRVAFNGPVGGFTYSF